MTLSETGAQQVLDNLTVSGECCQLKVPFLFCLDCLSLLYPSGHIGNLSIPHSVPLSLFGSELVIFPEDLPSAVLLPPLGPKSQVRLLNLSLWGDVLWVIPVLLLQKWTHFCWPQWKISHLTMVDSDYSPVWDFFCLMTRWLEARYTCTIRRNTTPRPTNGNTFSIKCSLIRLQTTTSKSHITLIRAGTGRTRFELWSEQLGRRTLEK